MNQIVTVRQHEVSDIERMARAFAASRLFGVQNPEQALALCLIAQAEGRHPASAAQDYHIINGRPSKKADAMLRDFLASGGKVRWHTLDDATADATFSHPAGGEVRISWDHARAKKAGIKNAMWDKYPRSMLRARVVSEGVRTVYPMATSGMYVPEEVQEFESAASDAVTVEGEVIETKPKRLARAPYAEMSAKIKACSTLADLGLLWSARETQDEIKSWPADWQTLILDEKNARKAELFDPAAFVTSLFAEMEDARTPEQVELLWSEMKVEALLADHADAYADAESIRASRLKALEPVEDDPQIS